MGETIETGRLALKALSAQMIEALLARDLSGEEIIEGATVPAGWPDEHDRRFLEIRLGDLREDPALAMWLLRAIVMRADARRRMIGHIGFHGPPRDGVLEIGYTVFPEWRRQGIALEAADGMMTWARCEHGVRRFRLSISPENEPSLAMAEKMGFQRTGEQWDEEDGLEWVFERELV